MVRKPRRYFHVYMLECSDGSYYTGYALDLQQRLETHQAGQASKYTRSRLPVKVIYTERKASKSAAMSREREIKKLCRQDKIRLVRESRQNGKKRPPFSKRHGKVKAIKHKPKHS